MDHAAAFGDAAQTADFAVNFKFHRYLFHHQIRGHDGFGRFIFPLLRERSRQFGYVVGNRGNVQFLADDAGGGNDHVIGADAQLLSRQGAHLLRNLQSVAVAGVGVSAIADDSLSYTVSNVFFGNGQRRAFTRFVV